MDKLRVYVAGPLTKGDLPTNIKKGTDAGLALMKLGYAPLVPHLSCYMGGNTPLLLPGDTAIEDWYGVDLPWVSMADAVLRIPGESRGADLEVERARKCGIPVFMSVEALHQWGVAQIGGPDGVTRPGSVLGVLS